MDKDLRCTQTAIRPLCPIVLAGLAPHRPSCAKTIFLQQALEPLLAEIKIVSEIVTFVPANPIAAKAVLESGSEAIAITNEFSANFHGLFIYDVLREQIWMPWLLFQNVDD